jgi:DNA-binding PadR family transcriptional regulator
MRTIEERALSALEGALLGLLRQEPRCGYDLRKVFAETPFVQFSDSPGAVYPALQRLERRGLLAPVARQPGSGRGRRLLRLTPRGLATFRAWLRTPVTREAVIHRQDSLMLQFAFLEELLGRVACREFLVQYERALGGYLAELETYFASVADGLGLSGRLAFESGLEGFRGQLRWAAQARRRLEEAMP